MPLLTKSQSAAEDRRTAERCVRMCRIMNVGFLQRKGEGLGLGFGEVIPNLNTQRNLVSFLQNRLHCKN